MSRDPAPYDPDAPRDPDAAEPQFVLPTWTAHAPFEETCGVELLWAEGGEALMRMPFTVKLAQGGGLLHGGALAALADSAVAMAIKSRVPEGTRFATLDMTTRFLAPVRRGTVEARARIAEWVGRDIEGEARISDGEGRVVAEFTAHFRIAREDVGRMKIEPTRK